jgi:hypothetical protein
MATDVDLVEWHAELGGKVLLHQRARLVLHQEVLLEHVVLLFGQARLHVACRRLLQLRSPASVWRRTGRVHGEDAARSSHTTWDDRRNTTRSARGGGRALGEAAGASGAGSSDASGTGFGRQRRGTVVGIIYGASNAMFLESGSE